MTRLPWTPPRVCVVDQCHHRHHDGWTHLAAPPRRVRAHLRVVGDDNDGEAA